MPLFGQSLFVVDGNLPTPALPPGALPAAVSSGNRTTTGQLSTTPDGSSGALAGRRTSQPVTKGALVAPPQPAVAQYGPSRPATPGVGQASAHGIARPSGATEPVGTGVVEASSQSVSPQQAQGTQSSGVPPSNGPNILPDQVGYASWYGTRFHGRLTASGQIYDMNAMTAANRTLPFGTKLRVTDLQNGKSVVVTINDRGPFVGGRIIDLSRAAAETIGLTGQGVARVRLHVIELGNGRRVPEMGPAMAGNGAAPPAAAAAHPAGTPGSNSPAPVAATPASATQPIPAATPPTSPAAGSTSSSAKPAVPSVVVQVGAFRDLPNAVRLKDFLAQNGFDPIYEKWENYTRVVLLPVPQSELAALRRRLEKIGITSILVRHN